MSFDKFEYLTRMRSNISKRREQKKKARERKEARGKWRPK